MTQTQTIDTDHNGQEARMTQTLVFDDDVLCLVAASDDGCQYVACATVTPHLLQYNAVSESTSGVAMHEACWPVYDKAWKAVYADEWAAIEDTMTRRAEMLAGA